jgi:hypothetical protein
LNISPRPYLAARPGGGANPAATEAAFANALLAAEPAANASAVIRSAYAGVILSGGISPSRSVCLTFPVIDPLLCRDIPTNE